MKDSRQLRLPKPGYSGFLLGFVVECVLLAGITSFGRMGPVAFISLPAILLFAVGGAGTYLVFSDHNENDSVFFFLAGAFVGCAAVWILFIAALSVVCASGGGGCFAVAV